MKHSRNREFIVSVHKQGKAPVTFYPKAGMTIGSDYACDIRVAASNIPACYRFIQRSGLNYTLQLFKGMKGAISRGTASIDFDKLIEIGLLREKGDGYFITLQPGSSGELKFEDTTVRFSYVEKNGEPMQFRAWPFISKADYIFSLILLLSLVIHAAFVYHLNTLDIKKKSHIEAIQSMAPRFARLILAPRQPAVKARAIIEKQETKDIKKEEPLPPPEPDDKTRAKDKISQGVMSKGVLGVISAKGGIMADLGGKDIFRDVDKLIANAHKNSGRGDTSKLEGMEGFSVSEGFLTQGKIVRTEKDIAAEKKAKASFGVEETKKTKSIKYRDEAEVYNAVKSYSGGLKYLYNNALRKEPSLKGKIEVKIVISGDGRVARADVVSSTFHSPELEEAIINRILKWRFKELKEVDDFTISYTFDFAPVG
ncbi:MAG: AgmX/PglI C-terminal domain-containing protein [Deltaproteobacteria bacterium]|nr:AgmX/PglI C-terminal domain-containing protein [Deltaproteobacteria bacterium]